MIENVLRWRQLCEEWSAKFPPLQWQWIMASIYTESSGNPQAYNPGDPSWGLFGVERLIAHAYGRFDTADDSWQCDPQKNASCAVPYLAFLFQRYRTVNPPYGFVGAYNAGETQFRKGLRVQPDKTYQIVDSAYLDAKYVLGWENRLSQIQAAIGAQ